jgi:UDP-N-acetylenolpyruvoylglucosamine reductase
MREFRVFEYDVVPVTVTRGAGKAEAGEEWHALRAALNQRGRRGFRVVAVTEGTEGRAVIMEREADVEESEPQNMTQAAEDITWESSREG